MKRYRTIWISDTHLGTKGTKSDFLYNFLRNTQSEYLYIVGDFIDGWRLKNSWNWISEHNDIIQIILKKAHQGTKVVYIPGNHDEFAREFVDMSFGNISIIHEAIHQTANGKRLLILHGDEYDVATKYARWLESLGNLAYYTLITLNRILNEIRRTLNHPYWSLSTYLKDKNGKAQKYFEDFRHAAVEDAKLRGYDGVVCGHIHYSMLTEENGIIYANTGDWVDNCTALTEDYTGTLELVTWTHRTDSVREEYDFMRETPEFVFQN